MEQITDEQKESISKKNIFIFETIGTFFLVYISVCSQNQAYQVALGYFGCILVFGRLSGGHFNPAITMAMALGGGIPYSTMFFYFLPQFLGAFLGAGLSFLLLNMEKAPYMEEYQKLLSSEPVKELAASLFGEMIGATIFLVFALVCMVEETKITKNKVASMVMLSCIYYACREYTITSSNSLLNPAAALSLTLFDCIDQGWDQLINLWIYVGGPIGAAILATMFYSQLYHSVTQRK